MVVMADRIRFKTFDQLSIADTMVYSKLPQHPFWSHVESKIDFSFADRLCAVLYTGRGQHPYAPSLKLKIHLVQAYYNLSDRQVEEKIIGDLFIKRFLGLPVDFFGFDHSTIGLDRSRMGSAMFRACHLYILAQMFHLGLWGDRDEKWIIDSFPCHAHAVSPGAYRLIQHAMVRLAQHLKRTFRDAYEAAAAGLDLDHMGKRLSKEATPSERMLAFSQLTAQAYAFLYWFETEQAIALMCKDEKKVAHRLRSLEHQHVLRRILQDYTQEVPPRDGEPKSGDDSPKTEGEEATSSREGVIRFEKIPLSERSSDRIVSAPHPDVRIGRKTTSIKILGSKDQVLCTDGGVILDTRMIPAHEHDRDAMVDMVKGVQAFFRLTPDAVVGDTAYGHGKQRVQLEQVNVSVIAPLMTTPNPTGLYDISRFVYQKDRDVFICPNGKETIRKNHNVGLEGAQHFFGKSNCEGCTLREACTTNKNGRTVFLSDYHAQYEKAKTFNETTEAKAALLQRLVVERKNHELKNNCGLGSTHATKRTTLNVKTNIACMVVNLKLVVRKLFAPKPGFLRRSQRLMNPV
jgi:hypothetical protein